MTTKPVRIIPVFRPGKGHEQFPDGYIIAEEDRAVRALTIEKPKPKKKARKCPP